MIIQLKDTETKIASPGTVCEVLKSLLNTEDEVDRDREHFWVFQLDTRNCIKVLELVSLGTLNASVVHPREVFCRAISNRANSILIAHNHPSGDPTPSHEDILITKQLREAGDILDVPLIDHVIIARDGYTSFKEQGLF